VDNLGYIVAGYTVTFLVITAYAVTLLRRVRRARHDGGRAGRASGGP
jgi:CcmD family protein